MTKPAADIPAPSARAPAPAHHAGLPASHLLLAICITAIWGTNFVVIAKGLQDFPPLTFAFLRFLFVLLPAVFFFARPNVPWLNLAAYGALMGGGQFGFLYIAMRHDITPGLASLVIQTQVFFTIVLSVVLTRERVAPLQWAAIGITALGLAVIGINGGGDASWLGLSLVLIAGLSWASANMVVRAAPKVDVVSYVVWSSLFALPPLALASLALEGPQAFSHAVLHARLEGWLSVAWQSIGNTIFGFAAWGWLLARHPAAVITPTALLVPVFGITASALLLGEPLQPWKLLAAALVIGGLLFNLLASRRR